ncbi:MAG TPA: hypothetical protein VLE96_05470 [Chlamydiales bacterium]|nr:hypothetical protein [Chlamydiales bacterium]
MSANSTPAINNRVSDQEIRRLLETTKKCADRQKIVPEFSIFEESNKQLISALSEQERSVFDKDFNKCREYRSFLISEYNRQAFEQSKWSEPLSRAVENGISYKELMIEKGNIKNFPFCKGPMHCGEKPRRMILMAQAIIYPETGKLYIRQDIREVPGVMDVILKLLVWGSCDAAKEGLVVVRKCELFDSSGNLLELVSFNEIRESISLAKELLEKVATVRFVLGNHPKYKE